MRTRIGIVGAGPAGLLLSHLLHLEGIDSVIIERQSRDYLEGRIRAGVLEHTTVQVLRDAGLGERMAREGLVHHGIELSFDGQRHRLDLHDLTEGKSVVVYGQHEVVKDLIARRIADGGRIVFNAADVAIHGFDGPSPTISYIAGGERHEVACDFIAGCDGFHGICRQSVPASAMTLYDRTYPFGWLGILAKAPPASAELIYARHSQGFALFSMRSPEITRLYLQCAPDDDVANWPDARIWDELHRRLEADGGWSLAEGEILQKGITAMRSFVTEPMQFGRLFLAGDAAHIVPPTGAKGMNLAVADVRVLARALASFYANGDETALGDYSRTCLRRIWKIQRFSWWMTSILHRFPDASPFDERTQLAELDFIVSSRAAGQALAENYVGLPFED